MKAVLLGSSGALSTIDRDNSSIVLQIGERSFLVDCNGTPARKLSTVGIDCATIEAILITHHHPDHIYALPSILHEMYLKNRTSPIDIFCPMTSLRVLKALFDLYYEKETAMFDARFTPLPLEEKAVAIATDCYEIQSSPMTHGIETLAYKFLEKGTASLVYATDTAPNQNLIRLAKGVDVLFHDCTYPSGCEEDARRTHHSTAVQAGKIAQNAGAKRLVLIHMGPECMGNEQSLVDEAESVFDGDVIVGYDFLRLEA